MGKLTHIKLENLTAFAFLDQALSPGINILIGANGTGKTHLLKTLYAATAITSGEDLDKSFGLKLRNVFNPYKGLVLSLVRKSHSARDLHIDIARQDGCKLSIESPMLVKYIEGIQTEGELSWKEEELPSVYIPVKEMLAHAPGFLATTSRREIAFEEVYVDIIKRAFLPKLIELDSDRQGLLDSLEKAIGGTVSISGEYFFLESRQGKLEFTLLAEGLRKIALIWLLIQNGTLSAGSILFWDEPEANLNPALMGEVVEVILELQRWGVQVFLATHNYVLLKEFDLRQKKQDAIRYISLFCDESGAVSANACDDYIGIDPNAIAATFDTLYDREVMRSLGGITT